MLKRAHSVTLGSPVAAHKSQKNTERLANAVYTILGSFHDSAVPAIIIKGSHLMVFWLLEKHKHPNHYNNPLPNY